MTIAQIIGVVVVVALAALGGFFIVTKSKKHDLAKWVGLFFLVALALTWILPFGYFVGESYTEYGMAQVGITHIPNLFYYAVYMIGDKVLFLLSLGAFYAVISKCGGYKKLVTTLAKILKGKEIITVLLASLLFTAMGSLLTQTWAALVFVPFVISVLLSMKLDKITAFSATFASIIIGTLGVTYGSEGLDWFNYYTEASINVALVYRLIVLIVGFLAFNFFNVLHIKKTLENKPKNETSADPYKIETVDNKEKIWPTIVVFALIFVLVLLGCIGWEINFEFTWFREIHEKLIALKIGELAIFEKILGIIHAPFGNWNLFHLSTLLVFFSIIMALISRINLNDYIENFGEGLKKMLKPTLIYVTIYVIMLIVFDANSNYGQSIMANVTNALTQNVEKFNPFLATLNALFANIFHSNFGLTGYSSAAAWIAMYGNNLNVIHTIFTTTYGFVSLCVPTSGLLLIGLSYLDIEYKNWMKYIWMCVLALLVILLILFTVMTYI